MFVEIVEVMVYVYYKGIVYCDFKLSNIFFDEWGKLCVIDFGFVKCFNEVE